jgi:hypothetical protein
MAEGEEIFTNYLTPHGAFESRHKSLLRSWQFDCDCTLCQADETPGEQHQDRAKMMLDDWPSMAAETETLVAAMRQGASLDIKYIKPYIARLESFASKLDSTYSTSRSAKLELSKVVFLLAGLWDPFDTNKALNVRHELNERNGVLISSTTGSDFVTSNGNYIRSKRCELRRRPCEDMGSLTRSLLTRTASS